VTTARHFLHRLLQLGAWAVLAAIVPPSAHAAPSLRQVTSVLTIPVPASAVDPATGLATVTVPSGIQLQVSSTKSWTMQVRATSATFTYVTAPGTGTPKSVAELQLRPAGGGTAAPVSTSYRLITSDAKTKGWGNYAYDVILQVTSADAGGVYSVTLQFNAY